MLKQKKSLIVLFVTVLISVSLCAYFLYFGKKGDSSIALSSVIHMAQVAYENNIPEEVDLAIEKVTLMKAGNPSEDFNYYKYRATVILKNNGADLKDARVVLRGGDSQMHKSIRNGDSGLSLSRGESYIVRDYEVLFDGQYNGGEIEVVADLVDGDDMNLSNNSYVVEIFEDTAKVKDVALDEILEDGTYVLDFNSIPFSYEPHDFYVATSDVAEFEEEDLRYAEIDREGQSYGYFRTKNTLDYVEEFDLMSASELESHFVEGEHMAVFVKVVNPDNDYFAVSNVLIFPQDEEITRAQFAKLFVEYSGEDLFNEGSIYFTDVSADEWYTPYVQTLYNLGFFELDSYNFEPDMVMSRGEALRVVMEYFDADLAYDESKGEFLDVYNEDYLYPYAGALLADAKGRIFGEYLNPNLPATKNYLKYLINDYSESY
ncbi:MAG: S-layer homology domain-containing protein [Candidatus Peregrinibacteria bacterium]